MRTITEKQMDKKLLEWHKKAIVLGIRDDFDIGYEPIVSHDETGKAYKDFRIILRKYKGKSNFVVIPPVQEIQTEAFKQNKIIKHIVIPDTVVHISQSAFEYCTSLEKVELGNGINAICTDMFNHCISLCEVNIPDNVRRIDVGAFNNCISLKNIDINKVEMIFRLAFKDCGLRELAIPEKVRYISEYAIYNCNNLETITFNTEALEEDGAFAPYNKWITLEVVPNLKNIWVTRNNKDIIYKVSTNEIRKLIKVI